MAGAAREIHYGRLGRKGRANEPLMRVGGIGSLAMSIRKIGDTELGDEMKKASLEAAQKIVPFAKAMVPVRSGALQKTIKAGATRRSGRIEAGTPSRVPYARAIHSGRFYPSTGTRSRSTKFISKAIPMAWPLIIDDYVKAMNRIAVRFERKHGVARVYGGFKK